MQSEVALWSLAVGYRLCYAGVMTSITDLEEKIAHLTRTVEDLSDIVARQERDNEMLKRRVGLLLEREAEREASGEGSVALADQRPPHW